MAGLIGRLNDIDRLYGLARDGVVTWLEAQAAIVARGAYNVRPESFELEGVEWKPRLDR